MRVFVTEATGFVGTAVVQELLGAGHQVLGLASSDAAAQAVLAFGAEVQRGSLADRDSWRRGVEAADGVIHSVGLLRTASDPAQALANQAAMRSLGAVLAGSDRPLVVAATLHQLLSGRLLAGCPTPCPAAIAAGSVRMSVVRLPLAVYGDGVRAFVPQLTRDRTAGPAASPGAGNPPWLAVHRREAARLFRLALEQAAAWPPGTRWPKPSATASSCQWLARH